MRERPDAPLGTLIFRAGLLPAETIENALEEGVRTGRRLGEILIERGLLREDDLAPLLAGQQGIPFVKLSERTVDRTAARLLDEEQARLLNALPIDFEEGVPVVAVTDPTNDVLMRNVREAVGHEVLLVVAARSELTEAIDQAYDPQVVVEPAPPAAAPKVLPVAEPQPAAPVEAPAPEPEAPKLLVAHDPVPPEPALPAPVIPEPAQSPPIAPSPVAQEPVAQEPAAPAPVAQEPAAPAPVAQEPVAQEPAAPAPIVQEPVPAAPVEPAPVAPAAVEHEPAPPVEAPAPAAPPVTPSLEPSPNGSHAAARVSIRLTTGERIVASDCAEIGEAKGYAKALTKQLGETESGDWPFVSGRFLKPDAIVSVDVEEL